jgi:hypothetical protein
MRAWRPGDARATAGCPACGSPARAYAVRSSRPPGPAYLCVRIRRVRSEESQQPLGTSEFDAFVEGLDYPMFVVRTRVQERLGCLIGFTTQASIDPPRLLVCLSVQNPTYRVARDAPFVAVHVLGPDEHGWLASSASRPVTRSTSSRSAPGARVRAASRFSMTAPVPRRPDAGAGATEGPRRLPRAGRRRLEQRRPRPHLRGGRGPVTRPPGVTRPRRPPATLEVPHADAQPPASRPSGRGRGGAGLRLTPG